MAKAAPKRAKPERRKPCITKAGTALAIIDTDMSEAHVDAKPCFLRHGGARNSKNRISDVLTMTKAQATIAAAYQALKIGLPFNRFVTIHFDRAGIADAQAADAIGDMMKLATDWMRKREHVIAYAWLRENDTGDGSKGSHVHILCHCPDALPIGRMWQRWLRNVSGRPYRAKSIKSERIGGTVNAYANMPAVYLQNLDGVLAYVCKGVSPADAATLGFTKQEAGGWIIGKRTGWSQNIGAKSRVLFTKTRWP
jgi:hypothetical protein